MIMIPKTVTNNFCFYAYPQTQFAFLGKFGGNFWTFLGNFWGIFRLVGFHVVHHIWINNFYFHVMAQKCLSRLKISLLGKFGGNFWKFLGNFLGIFRLGGFHIVPPIVTTNFGFHNMAQKCLSRLLPSTSYLPYSGPFKLVGASWGKPQGKNSTFPHSHIPIPSQRALVDKSGRTF